MAMPRMFLPVHPDGKLMEMRPLLSEFDALVAASRWTGKIAHSGTELSSSDSVVACCWRACGRGFGWSDQLGYEMAKAKGYTAREVFLKDEAE